MELFVKFATDFEKLNVILNHVILDFTDAEQGNFLSALAGYVSGQHISNESLKHEIQVLKKTGIPDE